MVKGGKSHNLFSNDQGARRIYIVIKQIWQNVFNWEIQIESIQVMIVLLFKFWKFFTIKTWKEYLYENSRCEKDSD